MIKTNINYNCKRKPIYFILIKYKKLGSMYGSGALRVFYLVTSSIFYTPLYSVCQAAKVIDRSRVSWPFEIFLTFDESESIFPSTSHIRFASNPRLKRGAGEKEGKKNRTEKPGRRLRLPERYNYGARRIIRGKAGAAFRAGRQPG